MLGSSSYVLQNLSVELDYTGFVDSISEKYHVIYAPEHENAHISWFVPVFDVDEIDEKEVDNVLLLCRFSDLAILYERHPRCFFLAVLEKGESLRETVSSINQRTIIVQSTQRFWRYAQDVQDIFTKAIIWEDAMDRIVYSGSRQEGGLRKLLEVTQDALGYFMCITDTGFNLIEYSEKINPPLGEFEHLVKNKCYDIDTIEYINSKVLPKANGENRIIEQGPIEGNYILHCPVYIDNNYLFHFVLVCGVGRSRRNAKKSFEKFMKRAERICRDFWKATVNLEASWHRVLVGLIDSASMSKTYVNTQMALTAIPKAKLFRLLAVDFPSEMAYKTRSGIVESSRRLNGGKCYPFMHGKQLEILCYCEKDDYSQLSVEKLGDNLNELVYEPYSIAAGGSQVFEDISSISIAFRQANIALQYKEVIDRQRRASMFDKPSLKAIVPFEHALLYYLMSSDRDEGLIEYSFESSLVKRIIENESDGEDVARIVWVYLCCGCNATDASKRIFFHRNTILYHISRLEQKYGFSFKMPQTRSRALLDFDYLFYKQCIDFD